MNCKRCGLAATETQAGGLWCDACNRSVPRDAKADPVPVLVVIPKPPKTPDPAAPTPPLPPPPPLPPKIELLEPPKPTPPEPMPRKKRATEATAVSPAPPKKRGPYNCKKRQAKVEVEPLPVTQENEQSSADTVADVPSDVADVPDVGTEAWVARVYPGQDAAQVEDSEDSQLLTPAEASSMALQALAEDAVQTLLHFIGEDVERDGLRGTPDRVVRAWAEMTRGNQMDPAEILGRVFDEKYSGLVVLKDIAFHSVCEHHMLGFHGTVTIGYLPGRVVGISKLARLVECFSRRLQIQERMTMQIADAITEHLHARGVAVLVKAHHSCMGCRGVMQAGTEMVTASYQGEMERCAEARAEFWNMTR